MSNIVETYTNKFAKSNELYQKVRQVIPTGGHLSRDVKPFPVAVESATGVIKTDLDGNQLTDYMTGYGALILGNSHPEVTKEIEKRLVTGTHMGTIHPLELEWAESTTGFSGYESGRVSAFKDYDQVADHDKHGSGLYR